MRCNVLPVRDIKARILVEYYLEALAIMCKMIYNYLKELYQKKKGAIVTAVFDLHADILTDIAIRREAGEQKVFDTRHFNVLHNSGINSLICVVWVEPKHRHRSLARFQEVLEHAQKDFAESEHVHLCNSSYDLTDQPDKINIFLGIEGMSFLSEALKTISQEYISTYFQKLHDIGFRTGMLAWNEVNTFASGSAAYNKEEPAHGLTKAGRIIIKEMMNKNWLVDVSHLDDKTFWDIYNLGDYPIFASHSNARALCDHDRNLTDDQLRAIAKRRGIVGLNAYAGFIDQTKANISDFINHIEYIVNLIGIEHVALGFDFMNYLKPHDLGTSFTRETKGLSTAEDVPRFLQELRQKGWDETSIQLLTVSNAKRFIKNMDNQV